MKIREQLTQFLNVPTTDPDDSRRRHLLNILLFGLWVLAIPLTITSLLAIAYGDDSPGIDALALGSIVMIVALSLIYGINRYASGSIASWIFLLFFVGIIATTDTPQELTTGRSLFAFSLPILVASFILPPYTSFYLAGLCSFVISILALSIEDPPNSAAIAVFFAIALISWLASYSLEQALQELRVINQELDKRVVARTQELSAALQQVQSESSKNQAILESIADGVVVFDNQNKASISNPSMNKLFELETDQIVGQNIETLIQQDTDKTLELIKQTKDKTSIARFERAGKTFSMSFAPLLAMSGENEGAVAVFRDFTTEAQLEHLKQQFFSMVTHELRTPLNAILGYTDMLKEGVVGDLNADQGDLIGRILSSGKRMVSLVDNLLDEAQMASGQLSLRAQAVQLDQLIREVDSVMSVLAKNRNLEFSATLENGLTETPITGDAQRIGQILINLTGNAIKFTETGAVKIHAYRHDPTHWAVAISDTGQGIPKNKQAEIFEPFKQVDDPITRKQIGSGLGLAIVKQLVTLMGGEVTLESELGKGSVFTVILPFTPLKQAQIA